MTEERMEKQMEQRLEHTFTIEEEDNGVRMDAVLSRLLSEEVSRSFLQKLIENGAVSVNGLVETSKKLSLKTGDQICVNLPEPEQLNVEPEDLPLSVVYEDDDVLVVDKPKGMVVHPAPGNLRGTLVNAVLFHCDTLSSINGVIRPGIVHRIDKDTSGLLMIAKNDMAHRSLAGQLEVHSITRAYEAVVWNNLKEEEGTVDAPIGRDPKNRLRMAVVSTGGRRAVTHYRILERFGSFTRLEARLETGRTHQIRVHMAYLKHPLLGDPLYGPRSGNGPRSLPSGLPPGAVKALSGVNSQMLHAKTLGFLHPATGEYMEFHSPLPQEFQIVLEALRGDQ